MDELNRAVSFYETMLGTKLEPLPDPSGQTQMMRFPAEMSTYGAGGALTKTAHAGPGVGGTIVYFMVEDCSVQQERVEQAGGIVVRPKFSIGKHGWVLLCQDTEGNMIGFNSMSYNRFRSLVWLHRAREL